MGTFPKKNGTRLLHLAALAVVSALLPMACGSGEIRLQTKVNGDSSDQAADAGGTGNEGGSFSNFDPKFVGLPCLVTEACFTFCSEDRPGCSSCETDRDCPLVVPLCDHSLNRCVECLGDDDCEDQFGEAFGECSLGRCVQCQKDDHCPGNDDCDDGWCGHCEEDRDCPIDYDCFRDHCIPEAF